MTHTITALQVQKGNNERVNLFLDGAFAFSISLMQAARLRKGQALTELEVEALRADAEIDKAYNDTIRLLAARPRSSAELRSYLRDKGAAPSTIDSVIERLQAQGYVDDAAFAAFWIKNRQQFKPRGKRALQFELRQKGLDDSIIQDSLAGLETNQAARQAAQSKINRLRGSDKRIFTQKLSAHLLRRGFDYDTVREVIAQVIAELEEADAGFFASHADADQDTNDTFDT
jgi:regulatory protein